MAMIGDYPKTDAEWQAQEDAHTLARAEQIKEDEGRLTAAKTAASKMAEKEREEMNAMRKVAGKRQAPAPGGSSSDAATSTDRGAGSPGPPGHNVFKNISRGG